MHEIQPIRVAYQKPGNLNFARHLSLIYRNVRDSLIFTKPVFNFSVLLYPNKTGLSKKLKVSTLNIRIKQSDNPF